MFRGSMAVLVDLDLASLPEAPDPIRPMNDDVRRWVLDGDVLDE